LYIFPIFLYSQTGIGKTHTIIGPLESLFDNNNDNFGLITSILNFLFNNKEEPTNIILSSSKEKGEKIDYS